MTTSPNPEALWDKAARLYSIATEEPYDSAERLHIFNTARDMISKEPRLAWSQALENNRLDTAPEGFIHFFRSVCGWGTVKDILGSLPYPHLRNYLETYVSFDRPLQAHEDINTLMEREDMQSSENAAVTSRKWMVGQYVSTEPLATQAEEQAIWLSWLNEEVWEQEDFMFNFSFLLDSKKVTLREGFFPDTIHFTDFPEEFWLVLLDSCRWLAAENILLSAPESIAFAYLSHLKGASSYRLEREIDTLLLRTEFSQYPREWLKSLA